MRKLTLILTLALTACAAPALAMSSPPTVQPGNQPVPLAEYNAVAAVNTCVRRVYDSRTRAQREAEGVQVDFVTVQTDVARQAQRLNNAPAFSAARVNVVNTVRALGYAC